MPPDRALAVESAAAADGDITTLIDVKHCCGPDHINPRHAGSDFRIILQPLAAEQYGIFCQLQRHLTFQKQRASQKAACRDQHRVALCCTVDRVLYRLSGK